MNFSTVEYAAQLAARSNGAAMRTPADGTALAFRASYTLTGAEADGDTLGIALLPAGAVLLPSRSSLLMTGSLSSSWLLRIGTAARIDGWLYLAGGGGSALFRFGPRIYTYPFTEPTPVILTLNIGAPVVVGTRLDFLLCWAAGT